MDKTKVSFAVSDKKPTFFLLVEKGGGVITVEDAETLNYNKEGLKLFSSRLSAYRVCYDLVNAKNPYFREGLIKELRKEYRELHKQLKKAKRKNFFADLGKQLNHVYGVRFSGKNDGGLS